MSRKRAQSGLLFVAVSCLAVVSMILVLKGTLQTSPHAEKTETEHKGHADSDCKVDVELAKKCARKVLADVGANPFQCDTLFDTIATRQKPTVNTYDIKARCAKALWATSAALYTRKAEWAAECHRLDILRLSSSSICTCCTPVEESS